MDIQNPSYRRATSCSTWISLLEGLNHQFLPVLHVLEDIRPEGKEASIDPDIGAAEGLYPLDEVPVEGRDVIALGRFHGQETADSAPAEEVIDVLGKR